MNKRSIPYGRQWLSDDDIARAVAVLQSDWITQGPTVGEFEQAVAKYVGARYAVAFSSGTAALHGAMHVAGVEKGTEVITSPVTFLATPNAAVYCGGRPVFADISPETYCLDMELASAAITQKTKVLAPVDLAGYPVDIAPFCDLAADQDCVVIEDAAHALGAIRNGRMVGSEADMTMFSFHPVKQITTGEGGMIVTNNEEYAEGLRMFRNHGTTKDPARLERNDGPWYYEMQDLGYNYRLTDIQSALGLSQLEKIESFVERRNEIATRYDEAFASHPNIRIPPQASQSSVSTANDRHAYHIYPVLLDGVSRTDVFMALRERGIFCQVHYIPVHLQPYYQRTFGYQAGDFPVSEWYYEHEITIPLYPRMSDEDVTFVIETFSDVMEKCAQ